MMRSGMNICVCAGLLMSAAATAQPSFDCTKADSAAEELVCQDSALAILDVRLSDLYQQTLDVINALDAGTDAALSETRATQRGWIKGRDECWKADNLRACVEAAYLTREGDLVARWVLQEPLNVVSYMCDDTAANEVTVFFFDTQLPSIRIEYGDSIRTGFLVPAASGARYATEFGGLLWTKGNDALFAWEEGVEMSCTSAP